MYREGKPVVIDGHTLSIPAVAATARYGATVTLDEKPETRERVLQSRRVIVDKVSTQRSVYGVSTGFGGSGGLLVRLTFLRLILNLVYSRYPHK